jgi:hypothetical protein
MQLIATQEEIDHGVRWEQFDEVGLIRKDSLLLFEVLVGKPIQDATWRSWIHRKVIQPVGIDWRNRPTYMLGDVRTRTLTWIDRREDLRRHGVPERRARRWVPRHLLRGALHPAWKGDAVCYSTVHERLRATIGKPCLCVRCGSNDRDTIYYHWALNWDRNPATKIDPTNGLHFSVDPDDYFRLCCSCHVRFDKAHARARRDAS